MFDQIFLENVTRSSGESGSDPHAHVSVIRRRFPQRLEAEVRRVPQGRAPQRAEAAEEPGLDSGDRAIRLGDVMIAAHAYIDAAVIASELRQGSRAIELSERAVLLAKSPLLSADQRSALLERMDGWGTATQVALR